VAWVGDAWVHKAIRLKPLGQVPAFILENRDVSIGAEPFRDGVDYCGDPESSFCERNGR